nr:MAG TPA: anaerobic ribonucleoside triphosphate reductase [Caudoviricetes sp.]
MINFETNLGDISEKEKQAYIEFVKRRVNDIDDVKSIIVNDAGNGEVTVEWQMKYEAKFERIARITGYLTGTTERWNNAKQAELKERVKHG